MSFLSTEGWAEKSKSERVKGDGRAANLDEAGPSALFDRIDLDAQEAF